MSVPLTTPGQNGYLTFAGTAGWRVSAVETMSAGICVGIVIYKPDMTVLSNHIACGSGGFQDPVTLPTTGTYTLKLDPSYGATATVTARLYNVVDYSGSIDIGGPAVSVPLLTPGQNARLTFAGTQGIRMSMYETISPGICAAMVIYKPDTTVLSNQTACGSSGFHEPITLPVTGTYTLLVDAAYGATATIAPRLYNAGDVTGTIVLGGGPVTVSLPNPGQNGQLTMAGTAGRQATVRLTGNTIWSVTVKLLKPDGSTLVQGSGSTASFNLATQTLPTTGTYTVVLDPYAASTGNITVTVTSP